MREGLRGEGRNMIYIENSLNISVVGRIIAHVRCLCPNP